MRTPTPPPASPPTVASVQHALRQNALNDPLPYLRLTHILSTPTHAHLPPLLTALTHFCAQPTPSTRHLLSLSLALPLPPPPSLSPLLENLISADPTFIPPVLSFAARLSLHPPPSQHPLLERLLEALLRSHPRAAPLLVRALLAHAPHPVRPPPDHLAFAASALRLARAHAPLATPLLHLLLHRLANLEALALGAAPPAPPAAAAEAVLLQLLAHLDIVAARPRFRDAALRPLADAYARAVVSTDAARFAPYALLYAASLAPRAAGPTAAAARLRLAFFDDDLAPGLRERFLKHSAWLVVRAARVHAADARDWVATLARWLNRYVDVAGDGEPDADVHRLFYKGCAALMAVVAGREDAFEVAGEEALNGMRVYRIMACGLCPLRVVEKRLVERFCEAVGRLGFEVGEGDAFVPSRSRGGGRNVCTFEVAEEECQLPEVRKRVEKWVRGGRKERVGSPASAIAVGDTFEDAMDEADV